MYPAHNVHLINFIRAPQLVVRKLADHGHVTKLCDIDPSYPSNDTQTLSRLRGYQRNNFFNYAPGLPRRCNCCNKSCR